jgi:O-antigen ligase
VAISEKPGVAWEGFVAILYFAGLYLMLRSQVPQAWLQRVWLGAAASLGLNAVFAILQSFGLFPLMVRVGGESLSGRITPSGFLGDVNTGGFLFGLGCLISLYWIVNGADRRLKGLGIAVFSINLVGLLFTRTLTALAACVICILLWVLFHHWWTLRFSPNPKRALALLWVVGVAALVTGGVVAQQAGAVDRVSAVADRIFRGDIDAATSGRGPVFRITWEMIQENPWLGAGLNSFASDFFFARADSEFGRGQKMASRPGAFRQAHNEYLQTWAEVGLLGLLLFLGLLMLPLALGVRRLVGGKDARKTYWTAVLCLGVIFVLVDSAGFFPFHLSISAAFIALLLASLRRDEMESASDSPRILDLPGWLENRWVGLAIVLVLFGTLAFGQIGKWMANSQMGLSAFLLERAQAAAPQASRIFADEAKVRLVRAESLCPQLYESHYLRGSAEIFLGRFDDSVEAFRKTAERLPSPEVYTNLAVSLLAKGEKKGARESLELALRYNPHFEKAQQVLATIN